MASKKAVRYRNDHFILGILNIFISEDFKIVSDVKFTFLKAILYIYYPMFDFCKIFAIAHYFWIIKTF